MIIELGTEVDKEQNQIKIFQTTTLAMSPIYTFFLRQMADVIDKNFGYPTTNWKDENCGAVYAEDKEQNILGHIVYSDEFVKSNGYLWITLSAIDEKFRGRGIYTILHKYFEAVAKEKGCWAIASHVHKNNLVRLESAKKVGMSPIFHFIGKKIA